MVSLEEVRQVVADVLQIGNRVDQMDASTALLGNIPEFDSMAVVNVITAFEEQYGFVVEDDEISAETFETLGSLHELIASKAASA